MPDAVNRVPATLRVASNTEAATTGTTEARPLPAKFRTSQAERLATASQAQARTNPRPRPAIQTPTTQSHLGRRIDIKV